MLAALERMPPISIAYDATACYHMVLLYAPVWCYCMIFYGATVCYAVSVCLPISLRYLCTVCCAMSGTDLANVSLRTRYATSGTGTDLGHAATRRGGP
eukprot:844087-Rhodomonas_salina.2